jgi:hypothetical protein
MVPAGEETISAKHFDDLSSGERRRLVVRAVLRTIVTVALVVTIYFLIPMDHATDAGTVAGLVLGLVAFVAVVAWQLPSRGLGTQAFVPLRHLHSPFRSTSLFLRRRTF